MTAMMAALRRAVGWVAAMLLVGCVVGLCWLAPVPGSIGAAVVSITGVLWMGGIGAACAVVSVFALDDDLWG